MKKYLLLINALFISILAGQVIADDSSSSLTDIKVKKVILKYNGQRLIPAKLELKKLDSSVFLLNQSEYKDISIAVDFKGKKMHCHSENLKLEGEFLKTQKPLSPRDFEILCFPSPGSYPYTVKELSKNGKVLKGEIIIHE